MKGTLKKIELKEFTNKEKGNKFSKIILTVDVEKQNGDIATYRGDMNPEYVKKYFKYCEKTTKDAIGEEVDVVLARRKYVADNVEKIYTYVKYMNFVKDGKPIIMPSDKKEDSKELDF